MKNKGFTLIELVVVIVILGILAVVAVPRLLNVSTDSHIAVVQNTGAAFKAGVDLAHSKVIAAHGGGPATNIPVYGDGLEQQLDFNEWGYPAQQWHLEEDAPRLDNKEDCMSLWNALFVKPPSISESSDANESEYRVEYIYDDQCRFYYNPLPALSIYYNSVNGEVSVDSDPTN